MCRFPGVCSSCQIKLPTGDHEPLPRRRAELGRERRFETSDPLLERFDLFDQERGKGLTEKGTVEGIKPCLEDGYLMDMATKFRSLS